MHKSCIAASTTRQRAHDPLHPDTHLNRRRILPRRGPKCGVIGRAPTPSKLIMVFLGSLRLHRTTTSIGTSIVAASGAPRRRTIDLQYK